MAETDWRKDNVIGNNNGISDSSSIISAASHPAATTSPPKLCDDIVYIIAEHMLTMRPIGKYTIDLRVPNPYTMFMCHNHANMNATLAQMAKMKRIVFERDRHGKREIRMYREKLDSLGSHMAGDNLGKYMCKFGGPYLVPCGFVSYLLARQKLRVTHIRSSNYLTARKCRLENFGDDNRRRSSLDAFCALFMDEMNPFDTLDNDLRIELLQLDEPIENIRRNFEVILLLNADTILLYCYETRNTLFDCSTYSRQISADRTRRITFKTDISVPSGEYASRVELKNLSKLTFLTNLFTCINYLLAICPQLCLLDFQLVLALETHIPLETSQHRIRMFNCVEMIVREICDHLNALQRNGNSRAKIRIELTANLEGALTPSEMEHPLFHIEAATMADNFDATWHHLAREEYSATINIGSTANEERAEGHMTTAHEVTYRVCTTDFND